jgi:hypothetical protein
MISVDFRNPCTSNAAVPLPDFPLAAPSASNSFLTTLNYSAKVTQIAAIDPGDGKIAWNTGGQSDATHLFIDTRDLDNRDTALFWGGLAIGSSIAIQKKLDSSVIKRYTITAIVNNNGWFDLTVTPGTSSGALLGGNDPVIVAVRQY